MNKTVNCNEALPPQKRLSPALRRLLLLLLLIGLGVQAGGGLARAEANPTDSAQSTSSSNPFGVWILSPADSTHAQPVRSIGGKWTLVTLSWAAFEPTPGNYQWSGFDSYLKKVVDTGFDVVISVRFNPTWAASTTCGPVYPQHRVTLANFVKAAVTRYSVPPYNVRYWGLYSEPDNADPKNFSWLGGCWGANHPNSVAGAGGAAYASLLKVVYPAVKAANPNAMLTLSGLAYDFFTYEGGPFDPYFVDDVLAAGGGNYFDAIDYHYYDAWAFRWGSIAGKGTHLQTEVRNATGVTKPLLTTETANPSAKPPGSGDRNVYSEELQARYVLRGFAQAMSIGVSPILWYEAVDRPEASGGYYYGLMHANLSPKPAYTTYQTLTRELDGARYASKPTGLANNVEGYTFDTSGGRRSVIWRNRESAINQAFPLAAVGDRLRVVDKLGNIIMIHDGDSLDLDKAKNKSVTIAIGPSPSIVSALPACAVYDLNGDLIVDLADINLVLFNSIFLNAPYNAYYDLIRDGVVDIADIFEVATQFGQSCP